ncbi:MAG: CpsD/CapB family tyrosine-protein kinase [Lachnospiraceae bacterium]|nr:CpsD/CapB family tyrosine-protein kinase [Lachnospiraceae bacterium]
MEENKKLINLYAKDEQIVTAAIDKIVVDLFNKREEGKNSQVIVLTGCSPLAGTTYTGIALGIAMANSQRKTLIIDCDVRKAIKYKKLNEEASTGLAECLLNDGAKMRDAIYDTNIENLSYMPCGEYSDYSTRVLCSPKMEELIESLRKDYECILMDVPSVAIVPDAQILFPMVDGIVLLSALGETRKAQIKDAKRKVAPFSEKYYGMIVNKIPLDVYRQNVKDYDYYFTDKRGEQKFHKSEAYQKYKRRKKQSKRGGQVNE